MEFGATYPFEENTPYAASIDELTKLKGSFGYDLSGLSRDIIFQNLPSYSRTEQLQFPSWKKNHIRMPD